MLTYQSLRPWLDPRAQREGVVGALCSEIRRGFRWERRDIFARGDDAWATKRQAEASVFQIELSVAGKAIHPLTVRVSGPRGPRADLFDVVPMDRELDADPGGDELARMISVAVQRVEMEIGPSVS